MDRVRRDGAAGTVLAYGHDTFNQAGWAPYQCAVPPDKDWSRLATELRNWEALIRRLAEGGGPKLSKRKWDEFIARIQRKIDEYHGPFKGRGREVRP